ncbi:LEC14B protein [Tetrabaena socialis]|uniref:LEC14B protein n=1 Tax=Tetrabaena socialis TaxID=47790 RepID=A0A2J8A915_9CHLO|nr:LEC14B protein [Tetrabaena socialis]|eukprot:PNH08963.1 LEC14B protein [Tetrabaena socialis]
MTPPHPTPTHLDPNPAPDDVNAVTYADASPNIIISGSDDTLIKVWDRRTMPAPQPEASSSGGAGGTSPRKPRPVGVLVGHTEGLTHLHSRGDGRYVLSNAKDQTAKLWDIRMTLAGGSLRDASSAARLPTQHIPQFNWDYRWQEYPAAHRIVRHPHDSSVQTYRGHSVQHTLIRAYFSPAHTTGQRFIYTGSVEGGVHVYDVVTGLEVEGSPLRLHRKLVRDVSWHPFEPVMATVSWDGTVARWDAVPPPAGSGLPEVPAAGKCGSEGHVRTPTTRALPSRVARVD